MIEIFYVVIILLPPLLLGVILAVGFLSPNQFTFSETRKFQVPAGKIWDLISNFQRYPEWLSYASKIESVNDESTGKQKWIQHGPIIRVEFEVTEEKSLSYLKTTQVAAGGPLSGVREFSLQPVSANETQLKITHTGEIKDPFMKSYMIIFHYRRNPVKIFMDCLEKAL